MNVNVNVKLLPRDLVPPVPPHPYGGWRQVPEGHPGRVALREFERMIAEAVGRLSWWTRLQMRWDPWTQAWRETMREAGVRV